MSNFEELYKSALKRYAIPNGIFNRRDSEERMARIFEYCIMMRTTEGIEDYINVKAENKVKFIMNKIAERLGLSNISSEENLKIIEAYLIENVLKNGFVAHTTNSKSAQDIMSDGFSLGENKNNTTSVLEEMKEIFPAGFFLTDLNFLENQKENREGWYYDRTPLHFARYKDSPEWFKRLTHEAYTKRNYEEAVAWITQVMDYYHESKEKKDRALEFLNKYWSIYAPTTPHILLVSTKDKDLRTEREKEYVEQLSIKERIRYYIEFYFMFTDQSSKEFIPPEDIIDIDYNQLVKEYQETEHKSYK